LNFRLNLRTRISGWRLDGVEISGRMAACRLLEGLSFNSHPLARSPPPSSVALRFARRVDDDESSAGRMALAALDHRAWVRRTAPGGHRRVCNQSEI